MSYYGAHQQSTYWHFNKNLKNFARLKNTCQALEVFKPWNYLQNLETWIISERWINF